MTEITSDSLPATNAEDDNHVSTVRKHLLDQMKALRGASSPEEIERELGRSKGVSELAQAVVNVAKVQVDYLKVTGQGSTPFLDASTAPRLPNASGTHDVQRLPAPGNGITSITQHRLKG
jgi:hypothetical protein